MEVLLGLASWCSSAPELRDPGLLVATAVAATVGLAAAGTVYGVMAAGLRVRETLLPLLILPVVAPVLLGADPGLAGRPRPFARPTAGGGWPSSASFAVIYLTLGVLAFGTLVEEA